MNQCKHPPHAEDAEDTDLLCRICGEVTTWSRHGLTETVKRLESLGPSEMPETPWVLHTAPPRKIGKSRSPGGPYVTVQDNEAWLENIRSDVSKGAMGARYRYGAIQHDLHALSRALRTPEESYW